MSKTHHHQQTQSSDNIAGEQAVAWFHALIELDRRVCNNCFGDRVPPEDSLTEHYEYFRSAGGVVTGGPAGDQEADVFCQECGAGLGTADLIILEAENTAPEAAGHPRLVRETATYARPDDDAEAGWREPTNLTQNAASEARGSPGRSWSEDEPMPLCGETVSLLQCVVRAAEQLEARHELDVDVEAAKDQAATFKTDDEYPERDREIIARVLADNTPGEVGDRPLDGGQDGKPTTAPVD